jgi:hypothetical protein
MDTEQHTAFAGAVPDAALLRDLTARVAERLHAKAAEINRSMNSAIEREIEDLNDPVLAEMLHASVEGNVTTILHGLRNDIPFEHIRKSPAATTYAIRLAQRGVPSTSLRRAYHIGSDDLLAFIFTQVQGLDCAPDLKLTLLHHLAGWLHRYVDQITRQVLKAHEDEHRFQLEQTADVRAAMIRRVLAGDSVPVADFAAHTGYLLDQVHLGAIVSARGANPGVDHVGILTRAIRDVAQQERIPHVLVTPADRTSLWVWFGREEWTEALDVARWMGSLGRTRIAFGAPAAGSAGFRRTHDQAQRIKPLTMLSTSPAGQVLQSSEEGMTTLSLLARDLGATRQWVQEVLGPLAADAEPAERLRETLRTFLLHGNSHTETAKELVLHRNSVRYRIATIERLLGRPVGPGELDLRLALQVCHVLGSAALTAPRD